LIERAAQVSGSKAATICNGRRKTYVEVRDRITRFATALRSLGCNSDARVAVLALNSDRYFEAYFAVPWAGCQIVPLNIRWSLEENLYAVNDSETEILLFDDAFADTARQILGRGERVRRAVYIGEAEAPDWAENYESLVENASPAANANVPPGSPMGVFYTGGTTGFPKGVLHSHLAVWSSGMTGVIDFEIGEDARYLHAAPMFHMADYALMVITTIVSGTHVIVPMFDTVKVLSALQDEEVTHVVLVPAMIQMLLADPSIKNFDLSKLRRIIYGAAPITAAVLEKAMNTLPDTRFVQAFGQTELAPLATILRPRHHFPGSPKLRSAGRATYCVNVKIVDEAGNEVPRGEVGEVVVRGPNAMLGYWNHPELTAETLRDGWVHTGDAARMDEDGFIYIADRIKDMIITGGENVFSAEVENAISSHEHVADVAVIGIPSEEWGESVHAIVILNEGGKLTEVEIIAHCRERIAGYKCPKSVEFRFEPFPLSGANKVLKTELRKPHWRGHTREVN
jgi:acyl-CoA synthetase (AMP-forming)/AMP-acid ligase II